MTSKRDLGPPLAVAGAVAVIGAVTAGFIAVRGPGDARDQRLDSLTMEKLSALASEAQCAFAATGKTYQTVAEMKVAADRVRRSAGPAFESACSHIAPDVDPKEVGSDGSPARPGDIDYGVINNSHIRLCGNFRRAYNPTDRPPRAYGYMNDAFPALSAARPAGRHCYDLELLPPINKSGSITNLPPPKPELPADTP